MDMFFNYSVLNLLLQNTLLHLLNEHILRNLLVRVRLWPQVLVGEKGKYLNTANLEVHLHAEECVTTDQGSSLRIQCLLWVMMTHL